MSSLFLHIILHLTLLAFVCAIALLLHGVQAAIYAWAIYVSVCLCWHWYNSSRLQRSLHTQHQSPPTWTLRHSWWAHIFTDIMRRERLHRKHRTRLNRALQRFQEAAESMPEGIVLLNKNGHIEWFNHLATQHFSFSPERALGSPLHKHIAHADARTFLQTAASDVPQEWRLSLPQNNGLVRHIRLIRIAFTRKTQLIISEDISRAEQLQAMRTAFIANVSHELRTPLTIIDGFLETLADHPDLSPTQQQEFIALMQDESSRMLHLINDLMTLSALEDPQQQNAPKAACTLSTLVQQIVVETQRLSAGNHIITSEIEDDIVMAARERELYQALSNLAFNAVRHNDAGCQIHISLQRINNPNPYKPPLARFAVRDTGKGIAAEHLPHLTERFYRADASRNRKNGGTGLGLAIAKHALANHQALLHIDSELGVGSEFATLLPTLPATASPTQSTI